MDRCSSTGTGCTDRACGDFFGTEEACRAHLGGGKCEFIYGLCSVIDTNRTCSSYNESSCPRRRCMWKSDDFSVVPACVNRTCDTIQSVNASADCLSARLSTRCAYSNVSLGFITIGCIEAGKPIPCNKYTMETCANVSDCVFDNALFQCRNKSAPVPCTQYSMESQCPRPECQYSQVANFCYSSNLTTPPCLAYV
jgi:hypothetical protein